MSECRQMDLVYKVRAEDIRVDHNQKQRTKDEILNERCGKTSFMKRLRGCGGRSGPSDRCLGLPKLLH